MITAKMHTSFATDETVVEVRITKADLKSINLDRLEVLQLLQPARTVADLLLDLHTLAFRQQQQLKAESPVGDQLTTPHTDADGGVR